MFAEMLEAEQARLSNFFASGDWNNFTDRVAFVGCIGEHALLRETPLMIMMYATLCLFVSTGIL
jgi:hypothetical protein